MWERFMDDIKEWRAAKNIDYIKADDVYALFNKSGMANLHIADIDYIKRADVAPVVHGQWIEKEWGYECSACDCCEDVPRNYCPNCGTKMDGE